MSLADMVAKQKLAQENKDASSPAVGGGNANANVDAGIPSTGGADAGSAPKRTGIMGLKLGGRTSTSAPAGKPTVSDVLSDDGVRGNQGDAGVSEVQRESQVGEMTLDDLESSESEGAPVTLNEYAFDDEIPATAPARELPEDLSDSQKAFVTQLDSTYEVVHDPELFGQMIRTIMQEMQENPDYMSLMADQDVHVMIRGLRSSMGLAKIKKAEKSTKTRAGKAAPKTAVMVNTLDELFNEDDF